MPKPVASALKNCYIQSFLEAPADISNHFWVQVAVSEAKRPLPYAAVSEVELLQISGVYSSWTPGAFYTYFYTYFYNLETLLYFKPLLDPGGGFTSETDF
jgi:hypothetical protein